MISNEKSAVMRADYKNELKIKINVELRRAGMLILTRKVGESVIVGNDVKITVLHAKGNQIRLGIHAPASVSVHREEIFARIHQTDSVVSASSAASVVSPLST